MSSPSEPMDCSLPGSSVHGILHGRRFSMDSLASTGVGCHCLLWNIQDYYSFTKKKKNLAICDNMDRSWGHCVEWKKWDRKRQISYDFAHGWAWALQRQWDIVHAHAQLCPTLCDHMDCSPSDSSGHGIFQARILEWGAISSFRASSWLRDWTCCLLCLLHCRGILYPLSHQGSPFCSYVAHMKNK